MAARKAKRGNFRVIGGRWRGRRLDFVDDGSVRPTPDRIRETLFNWLADWLPGARCVDLFAGSGALGIEALSRGAQAVTFVDTQRRVLTAVRHHIESLQAEADYVAQPANSYLQTTSERFDIAFVDPPYQQGLVEPVLKALQPRLSTINRVYVECESTLEPVVPIGWSVLKSKRAGQVGYHLYTYSPEAGEQADG